MEGREPDSSAEGSETRLLLQRLNGGDRAALDRLLEVALEEPVQGRAVAAVQALEEQPRLAPLRRRIWLSTLHRFLPPSISAVSSERWENSVRFGFDSRPMVSAGRNRVPRWSAGPQPASCSIAEGRMMQYISGWLVGLVCAGCASFPAVVDSSSGRGAPLPSTPAPQADVAVPTGPAAQGFYFEVHGQWVGLGGDFDGDTALSSGAEVISV